MTLKEKIDTINVPEIKDTIGLLPDGGADTIKEFFYDFVEKRLPDENVIRGWHKVLMDYTSDFSNLSCCVRFGNKGNTQVSEAGEVGYDKLRRGWLTKNNSDNFEYFFTDNHFCCYIYKMVIDGFVPDLGEISEIFHSHEFPYGFMYYLKNVPEGLGAVVAMGDNPGFSSNYKISHVFDAGAQFLVNGKVYGDEELSNVYYPIGHTNDFMKNPDRIRRMDISDDAKKVIVAKFLRFVHPFNYFLTPTIKPKLHKCAVKVEKNDIGEDPRMVNYVRNYLKIKYPDIYKEFLEKVLWPYDFDVTFPDTGDEYIGITYGPHLKSASASSTSVAGISSGLHAGGVYKAKSTKRDYYIFNGGEYNQREVVLAFVKKFCEDNPDITYKELTDKIKIILKFNRKPIIRLFSDLSKEEIKSKRAAIKSPITLVDGNVIVVNNQVQGIDMPEIIRVADTLGYTIEKK